MAAILIGAAVLKGHQLATGPVVGSGFFSSRVFLIALVEFEWLMGVWLLSGLYPRQTWQVALACFAGFACVSLYKGLSGDASCGCFGRLEVSPWYMLVLDVGVVLALLVWPPGVTKPQVESAESARRFRTICLTFLAVIATLGAIPGAVAMAAYSPATLAAGGMITGEGMVVLDPQKWVGSRFPLLNHIDIGTSLADGDWIVVIYRDGCPNCQYLNSRLAALAEAWQSLQLDLHVAFLELPPFRGSRKAAERMHNAALWGKVGHGRSWQLTTPTIVLLSDAKVVLTRNGESAREWACRLAWGVSS